MSMPSLRSSPWMRGAPQSGLARLISRISRRISGVTLGLPARRLDFQRQKERKPARCHRITVSGPTIVMASRIRGAIRYKQTKIIRLKLLKTGRRGDVRRSTFSLWRRASISAPSDAFERNRPRSIHLIRLSRSRIEHSSPDSDVHAKRTEFAVATGGEAERNFAVPADLTKRLRAYLKQGGCSAETGSPPWSASWRPSVSPIVRRRRDFL